MSFAPSELNPQRGADGFDLSHLLLHRLFVPALLLSVYPHFPE